MEQLTNGKCEMTEEIVPSDIALLDLLRKRDSMTVSQLAAAMQVTATAVRQRLNRLLAQGLLQRSTAKSDRGRPSHEYRLTAKGRRQSGANFADLAVALWQEIKEIKDPDVRRGLLQRIAGRLATTYADWIDGETIEEKMQSIVALFADRRIPFEVEGDASLPILTALACPYPELAEQDRSVCAMERQLFSEILGERLRLTKCRLDGETCCTFELHQLETAATSS